MGASVTVIQKPYFALNSVDYSAQVKELALPFSIDEIESTASGDTAHVSVPGLVKFSMSVKAFRSLTMDNNLWALLAAGTIVTCEFRKSTDAVSASNPKYTASVFVSAYPLFGGGIGAADEVEITLSANAMLQRATS